MRRSFANDIFQVLILAAGGVLTVTAMILTGPGSAKLAAEAAEKRFWTFKVHRSLHYDAVVIGDSRAYRGFDPEIFERETHLRAINLGFSSAGFSKSLFTLAEQSLSKNGAKLIILAVTPFSLTEEAAKNEHLSQWVSRSQSDLLSIRYFENILVYFSPAAIKAIVPRLEENPYTQEFYESGFVHSNRKYKEIASGLNIYSSKFKTQKVSPRRLSELVAQIRNWQKEGYQVIAYRPPVDPKLEEIENSESGWHESEWVSQMREIDVPWIRVDSSKFESYDGSHLTGESARDFTQLFSQEIIQRLRR